MSDPTVLELEGLQPIMWVEEPEPKSSARATSAKSFLQPDLKFLLKMLFSRNFFQIVDIIIMQYADWF